ncbi:MAG: hypothetical protein LBG45_08525 [Dysgonamonadaceae bacterium]|nr:hypothetical protein [Dysgonamonadaceae bacterium]
MYRCPFFTLPRANFAENFNHHGKTARSTGKVRSETARCTTRNTAGEDIKPAQELFRSKHHFDFDFRQQWQIKDLVDTILACKQEGKQKERIAAQKVLKEIIGSKPEPSEDPKRMEKNIFHIRLNNNRTTVNVSVDKLGGRPRKKSGRLPLR